MSFRIMGLSPAPFRHLFGQTETALAELGVERHTAAAVPGWPDRIELRDAEPGETLLLLNYVHQPADNPYRASHAIFVAEGATRAYDRIDTVPGAFRIRTMSFRGFDISNQMIDARLADGKETDRAVEQLFADQRIDYIQAHYAMRGCYAARIERVRERNR